MKAKVIKAFRDADNFAKVYKVGDVVDFDDVRVKKCVELGLVEVDTQAESVKSEKRNNKLQNNPASESII